MTTGPRVIPAEVLHWTTRYQAGDSILAIAVATGRSTTTIGRHLAAAGVEIRPQGWAGRHAAEAIRAARTETGRG